MKQNTHQEQRMVVLGLAISLLLRLSLSFIPYAFQIDLNSFTAWSSMLAQGGIPQFYSLGWCDYPPGYLYILWLIGKLFQVVDPGLVYTDGALFRALLKWPAIFADIGCAWLIYQLLRPIVPLPTARWSALLYAFNPLPFLISAVWGQIDGIIAFLMLLTVWLLQQGALIPASLIGVLGVLVKPQGLFLAPAFVFSQWYRHPWWKWPLAIGSSLLLIWGVVIPFYWSPQDFSLPDLLLNPFLFLYERMMSTANGYTYASVNAFNFWGWANWQQDSQQILGLSYKLWGFSLLGAVMLWIGFFLYRQKQPQTLFLGVAMDLMAMFMLPTRMHERYVLYAIPFLALAAACFASLAIVYWGITLGGVMNSLFVIGMYNHAQFFSSIPDSLKHMLIMGNMAINMCLFLGLLGYAIRLPLTTGASFSKIALQQSPDSPTSLPIE